MRLGWQGVGKDFGGVPALGEVTLEVASGSCHALLGENGAGKSTLARLAAGILRPDRGTVTLDGAPVRWPSPREALAAGVALVHQELAFCPELSVAENLSLGRWPVRRGRVDRRAMEARARELLAAIQVDLDVALPMGSLDTAHEQLVQIAAAVGTGARVLLMDEPTASLSDGEARALFELMADLRARGTTIVYVSHRIPEVLALCDRMSVLRDGALAGTVERADADEAGLVRLMVGRDVDDHEPEHVHHEPGEVLLEVEGLSSPAGFQDVSLTVRAGEVVGLAGLVGAGRSALARALFGLDRQASGRMVACGRTIRPGRPASALAAGVGLVPEDRKRQGLVLAMDSVANQSLAVLDELRRGPRLDRRAERTRAAAALERVELRAARLDLPVAGLSGGNQQKVVVARWIDRGGRVLIVDEPTRGVDVGAKAALHKLLDELACAGLALLVISSDLPELLNLSRRVLVFREGRVVDRCERHEARAERVLAAMTGVEQASV